MTDKPDGKRWGWEWIVVAVALCAAYIGAFYATRTATRLSGVSASGEVRGTITLIEHRIGSLVLPYQATDRFFIVARLIDEALFRQP